jgi:hypothetical protein
MSGKEGSLYEEEYLIDSLKRLIPNKTLQGNTVTPVT